MFIAQSLALTKANLKSRYRNSFSGFIWVILNPLILFTAQGFAFHFILNINVYNFPIFLMSGLLPWIFLTQTLEMSAPILVWQGGVLKSFRLSPLVFIMAQVVDNGINFLAAFLVALGAVSFFSEIIWWHLLFLPFALLPLFITTLSLSWLIAGANVLVRDLKFVMTFLLNISYFLTPIFYPLSLVPEQYKFIILMNPFYYLINPFRELFISPLTTDFVLACSYSLILSLFFLFISLLFWRLKKNVIYFNL